jgi:hypothetical protein
MNELGTGVPVRGGRMKIPRSRGAMSGFLLILLGAWGALIPFIGPSFDFAYTPDQEWIWTTARGWLEVLPGAATAVGGLLLLTSGNRAIAMFGGWLSVLAGAWFVVGRAIAGPLRLGDPGAPVASSDTKRVWLELCYFSGLGVVIVFLGALALGRVSVRSLRDVQHAHRPVTAPAAVPEATTGRIEPTYGPRHAEPQGLIEAKDLEEPPHRGFGGLFRRHDETTTARR